MKKFEKGEITVILTIATLLIMASTALVSSLVLKNKKTTTTKATAKEICAPGDGGDYGWGPSDICYDISGGEGSYQACPANAQSRAACCLAYTNSYRLCCGSASTVGGERIFDYLDKNQCQKIKDNLASLGASCSYDCGDAGSANPDPTAAPTTVITGVPCENLIQAKCNAGFCQINQTVKNKNYFFRIINRSITFYIPILSVGSCLKADTRSFNKYCCGPKSSPTPKLTNTPTPTIDIPEDSDCLNDYQKTCSDFTNYCVGSQVGNNNVFFNQVARVSVYSDISNSSFYWGGEKNGCKPITNWRSHCCVPSIPTPTPTPTPTITPTPTPTLSPNLKVETYPYNPQGDPQLKDNKDDPFCRGIFSNAINELAQKGVIDPVTKANLDRSASNAVCRHTVKASDGKSGNRINTYIKCNKSWCFNCSDDEYCFVDQEVFNNYIKNKSMPFFTTVDSEYISGRYISSNSCAECQIDKEICLQIKNGLSTVATYCISK